MIGFDPPQYDFQLIDTKGYWIWASAIENIPLLGTRATAPISRAIDVPVGGGWAMVGLSSFNATWKAGNLQSQYAGREIFIVGGWNAAPQTSYAFLPGIDPPIYDFALSAGHSYWIWVSMSGTLTYAP